MRNLIGLADINESPYFFEPATEDLIEENILSYRKRNYFDKLSEGMYFSSINHKMVSTTRLINKRACIV